MTNLTAMTDMTLFSTFYFLLFNFLRYATFSKLRSK